MKLVEQTDDALAVGISNSKSAIDRFRSVIGRIPLPNIAGTVGTQLGMFGLHALHSVILARLLDPHGRGEYGTAVLFTQLLMYSGMLGTSFSIARRAGKSSDGLNALGNASLRVGVVTGLISFAVVCLLALFALPDSKAYLAPLCIANALLLPFEHARLALLAVDHGSGAFRRYNVNRLIAAIAFPILLGIAWGLGAVSVQTATWLSVLTTVIALGALLKTHNNVRLFQTADPPIRTLLHEGMPYATSYFAAQLLGRIDTLLVLWLLNFTDQGYYAVAIAASSLMQVVPNALSLFSFNLGASKKGKLSERKMFAAGGGVLVAQLVSAVGMAFLLIYCLPLIFGEKFVQATPFAIALLPGLAIDGLATVAEGYLRGCGRPLSTLMPRTLGAITLVIAAYFLFPTWNSLSIPIASSIAHSVSGFAILGMVILYQNNKLTSQQEPPSKK